MKDYTEAIRLNPDNANAFNNRANARYGKGDLEEAIKDYTEAIRLDRNCQRFQQPGHCAVRERRPQGSDEGLHRSDPAQSGQCQRLSQPRPCAEG